MNYWILTLWDKQTIRVKPNNVEFVKSKLEKGDGHIITATRTVAVKDIKSFDETDTPYIENALPQGDTTLLEQAAQAFGEPVIANDGAVKMKAVKKFVPQRRYDQHYSQIPAYTKLSDEDGRVLVGFWVSLDQVNPYTTEPCTNEEMEKLK